MRLNAREEKLQSKQSQQSVDNLEPLYVLDKNDVNSWLAESCEAMS
jgi:hypothetical protein